MSISKKIQESMEKQSWVRKMFEEGAALKAEYGEENVFDFSLGNPNLAPPDSFYEALQDAVRTRGMEAHGYMANAGFPETRASVAE